MKSSRFSLPALLVALALPAVGGTRDTADASGKEPPARASRTGHWRFSGGAAWRSLGDISWDSGTPFSSLLEVPSLGTPVSPDPGVAGPAAAFADRFYNDGFVKLSPPTATTGETWNWGYENASQDSGGAINYHGPAGNSVTITSDQDYDSLIRGTSGSEGISPYFAADYMFDFTPTLAAGPQFSFMFMSFDAGRADSNWSGWQRRTEFSNTLTDRYNLRGILAPQAPYAGTTTGPGPLLHNLPSDRSFTATEIGRVHADYTNLVSEKLDVDLATLSAGGQIEWHDGKWSVRGGAGFSLNVANTSARRTETLRQLNGPVLEQWSNSSSSTKILPGFYLSIEAAMAVSQDVSISLFGRHDWSSDLSGHAGSSSWDVDLDGWTLGAAVNVRY